MGKSIGSLYIDIVARTEQLEKDVAKAKTVIAGLGGETRKAGEEAKKSFENFKLWNSFQGRGMTGIVFDMTALMLAVRLAGRELKYVWDNIEHIPGVNPVAIQGINEFKVTLMNARKELDTLIANWVLSPLVQAGQATVWGMAENFFGVKAEHQVELPSLDELKRAQMGQAAYDKAVDDGRKKLNELRKELVLTELREADRYVALQKEAEIIRKSLNNTDTIERLSREAEMTKKLTEAEHLRMELGKRLITFQRQAETEATQWRLDEMSHMQRIVELKRMLTQTSLGTGLAAAGGPLDIGNISAMPIEVMQLMHDKFPEVLKYWKELRGEYSKIKTSQEEFRDAFTGGFKEMSVVMRQFVTGMDTDFNKVLKNIADKIIETFFDLALINPILNGMFGGVRGSTILPALWGIPGHAAGGPGSGWSLVGEQGPELVNLPGGSSVVPSDQTRRMFGGGSGGGNVYQIDARGTDASVVARLQELLFQLAGPGVVEQRALSASKNAEWRRRT